MPARVDDITGSQNVSDLLVEDRQMHGLMHIVGNEADSAEIEAYAVGGFVRDLLLGRRTTDIDFVTVGPGTGIRLAQAVGERLGGTTVHVYKTFGTAAIRLHGDDEQEEIVLEFVAARRESYARESRKPAVEDGTLADDQLRRDFTVNALAFHLAEKTFGDLLDPFGGVEHLRRQLLVTPRDPLKTFDDDPLRMVRAARFASQLGFTIERETLAAMRKKSERISIVSQERISEELGKIIDSERPSTGLMVLYKAGILAHVLPELVALEGIDTVDGQRHKDNFLHTLKVLDNLVEATEGRPSEETRWLRWAALLHDVGKAHAKRFKDGAWTFHGHEDKSGRMVKDIFRRLRLPTDERMRYVQKLVRLHHRPVSLVDESVTDSAVRRLLFDAGEDIDDLMTLVRADITSKNPQRVRRYLRAFDRVDEKMIEVEEKDRLRQFQPPVDGTEIMRTLGLKPGRAVGVLKEAVREAILDGIIPNEHDAAFAYLMSIKDELIGSGDLAVSRPNREEDAGGS